MWEFDEFDEKLYWIPWRFTHTKTTAKERKPRGRKSKPIYSFDWSSETPLFPAGNMDVLHSGEIWVSNNIFLPGPKHVIQIMDIHGSMSFLRSKQIGTSKGCRGCRTIPGGPPPWADTPRGVGLIPWLCLRDWVFFEEYPISHPVSIDRNVLFLLTEINDVPR